MYEKFYGLSHDPFRLLPDSGVCYPHRSSASAWAYLRYALKRGEGIVVVTGAPGSGKTTLAHRLLNEVDEKKVFAVSLVADDLSPSELLLKVGYAMGLSVEGKDRAMMTMMIEQHLHEMRQAGRRVLLLIDEAQSLSHQALETARRLSDLQEESKSMFQLILFGQEQLESALTSPDMEQFQHRVIARCQLQPMTAQETKAYLRYRLSAADWKGNPSFNGQAVMAIHHFSRGLPRHINKICSRLLLHAASEEKVALDENDVKVVVSDLRNERLGPDRPGTMTDALPPALGEPLPTATVERLPTSTAESRPTARRAEPVPPQRQSEHAAGGAEAQREAASQPRPQPNQAQATQEQAPPPMPAPRPPRSAKPSTGAPTAVVAVVGLAAVGMLATIALLGTFAGSNEPDFVQTPAMAREAERPRDESGQPAPGFMSTDMGSDGFMSGSVLPPLPADSGNDYDVSSPERPDNADRIETSDFPLIGLSENADAGVESNGASDVLIDPMLDAVNADGSDPILRAAGNAPTDR
jgi:type II secretory pathway predicted ATPase ExeA